MVRISLLLLISSFAALFGRSAWAATPPTQIEEAIGAYARIAASGKPDDFIPLLPSSVDWRVLLRTSHPDPEVSRTLVRLLAVDPAAMRMVRDPANGDWLARQVDGLQLELRYRGEPGQLVNLRSRALDQDISTALAALEEPHARYLVELQSASRMDAPLCQLSGRNRNRLGLVGAMKWPASTSLPALLRQVRAERLLAFGRFEQALGNDLSDTPSAPSRPGAVGQPDTPVQTLPPGLLLLRGEALLRSGRAADALAQSDAMLALAGDDALALVLRGSAQRVIGERDAAVRDFHAALRLMPAGAPDAALVRARLARLELDQLTEAAPRWRDLPEGQGGGLRVLERLWLAGDDQGFDAALAVHLVAWPDAAEELGERWGVAPAILAAAAREGLSAAHWKEVTRLSACEAGAKEAPRPDVMSRGDTDGTGGSVLWLGVLIVGAVMGAALGGAIAGLWVDKANPGHRIVLHWVLGISAVVGALTALFSVAGF